MVMFKAVRTLAEVQEIFGSFGVDAIYFKNLATNQDNEKNQIYLGGGIGALTNIFPGSIAFRSASESIHKRASEAGKLKIELTLNFAWITRVGALAAAPDAKIIDYFQYPEVRFSGFLKRCSEAPKAVRRELQDLYGRRILALGVRPNGQVVGMLLTALEDPLVDYFPDLPSLPAAPILKVLLVSGAVGQTPGQALLSELRAIVVGGWHRSVRLPPGASKPVPFSGAQGGGYTLEALLGVESNAVGEPDKYGFEVKAYSSNSSHISIMTPTGDLGVRGTAGFEKFVVEFGHEAKNGDGRRHFTGTHRAGSVCSTSGLKMEIVGYDSPTNTITGEVRVILTDDRGKMATGWSIKKLGDHWNRKHASAVYIGCSRRPLEAEPEHKYEYMYGPKAFFGEGTSVHRLLKAIALGVVYYDPADEIEAPGSAPKRKERPQWRISRARLEEAMRVLYDKVTVVDLPSILGSQAAAQPSLQL